MSYVQSAIQNVSLAGRQSLAFTQDNAPGNLLIVGCLSNANPQPYVTGVADTQGNSWYLIKATPVISDGSLNAYNDLELWYCPTCLPGPNTVTVTFNSTCNSTVIIAEYSGLLPVPLDQVSSSFKTGTSVFADPGAVQTSANAELLIGLGGSNIPGDTWSAAASYTLRQPAPSTVSTVALEDQSVSVIGSYDATFVLGGSHYTAAIMATFKLAGPPTPPAPWADPQPVHPAMVEAGRATYFRGVVPVSLIKGRSPLFAGETRLDDALLSPGQVQRAAGIVPAPPMPPPKPTVAAETASSPLPPLGETSNRRGVIPVPLVKPPLPTMAQQAIPTEAMLLPGWASFEYGGPAPRPAKPVYVAEDLPFQPYPPLGAVYVSHGAPPQAVVQPRLGTVGVEILVQPFPPAGEVRTQGKVPISAVSPPRPVIAAGIDFVFPSPGFADVAPWPTVVQASRVPAPQQVSQASYTLDVVPSGYASLNGSSTAMPAYTYPNQPGFTFNVRKSTGGIPQGTVSVSINGQVYGSATLGNSSQIFVQLQNLPPGTYTYIATYSGQGLDAGGSASLTSTLTLGGVQTSASLTVQNVNQGSTLLISVPVTSTFIGGSGYYVNPLGNNQGGAATLNVGFAGFQGKTTVLYDLAIPSSSVPAGWTGQSYAATVLADEQTITDTYQQCQNLFGSSVVAPSGTLVVTSFSGAGAVHISLADATCYCNTFSNPADPRMTNALYALELSESFQWYQNSKTGWQGVDPHNNNAPMGQTTQSSLSEGNSRISGDQIWQWPDAEVFGGVNSAREPYIYLSFLTPDSTTHVRYWTFQGVRYDMITDNVPSQADNPSLGAVMHFFYWLTTPPAQGGPSSGPYTAAQIYQAAAFNQNINTGTLAGIYQVLTGRTTALADFTAATYAKWPTTSTPLPGVPNLYNPNFWVNNAFTQTAAPSQASIPPMVATGTATLQIGSTTTLTASVVNGVATFNVPATLAPGTYPLTFSYPGNGPYGPSTATSTLKVSPIPGLVQPTDLQYLGAFRVPDGASSIDSNFTFNLGDGVLCFNPGGNGGVGSLFTTSVAFGNIRPGICEISIPTNLDPNWSNVANLPQCTLLQNTLDVFGSPLPQNNPLSLVSGGSLSRLYIMGMVINGGGLVCSAVVGFTTPNMNASHFTVSSLNWTNSAPAINGFWQLATPLGPTWAAGYMCPIPSDQQGVLGNKPFLTGLGGANVSQTVGVYMSAGPAAYGFDPANFGDPNASLTSPVPVTSYVYYRSTPTISDIPYPENYPWRPNPLWGISIFNGVLFIPGTRTILYLGSNGNYSDPNAVNAYGDNGTTTLASPVQGQIPDAYDVNGNWVPNLTLNDSLRLGRVHGLVNPGGTGEYIFQATAYTTDEFASVVSGAKQPWQARPYATWDFTSQIPSVSRGRFFLGGATYDPAAKKLYVSQQMVDILGFYTKPIIHVFKLNTGAPPPPPAAIPTSPVLAIESPLPQALFAAGSVQTSHSMPLIVVKPPLPVISREDRSVQPFPLPGSTQIFVAIPVSSRKTPLPAISREDRPLPAFPPPGETHTRRGIVPVANVKAPPPTVAREDAPIQTFPGASPVESRKGGLPKAVAQPPLPVIAREDSPVQPYPGTGFTQSIVGAVPIQRIKPSLAVIATWTHPLQFPDPGFVEIGSGGPLQGGATVVLTAPTSTYPAQPTVTVQVFDVLGNPAPSASTVTLSVDGAAPLSGTLDSTGSASFALAGLQPGDHTLTANFPPQHGILAGSATGALAVGGVLTSVAIESIGSFVRVAVQGSFLGGDGYNRTDAPASPVVFVGQAGPVTVLCYSSLGQQGLQCAASVLSRALADYQTIQEYFGPTANIGGVAVVVAPLSSAHDGSAGARHDGLNKSIIYTDAAFQDARITSAGFVAELVERAEIAQAKGWLWNGGNGEALSRVLAQQLYPGVLNGAAVAGVWLDSFRPDYVNVNATYDNDALVNGCDVLFLWWLVSLGYTLEQIAQAGGATLALLYQNLTGKRSAWTDFQAAVSKRWPAGAPSGVTNDNAWQNPKAVPPLLGPPLLPPVPPTTPTGNVTLTVGSGAPVTQALEQGLTESTATFAIPQPTAPVSLSASYPGVGCFTPASITGTLSPSGYRYGLLEIAGRKDLEGGRQEFIGLFSITNPTSGDAVTTVDLAPGDNTIAVPAGGPYIYALVIPPAYNKAALLLKGASGDAGIPLHPSNPTVLGLAPSQASLILSPTVAVAGVVIQWI